MPSASLLLTDATGAPALERFSCTEDAEGWTWTSTRSDPLTGAPQGRLDLQADPSGVVRRLSVEHGAWRLRGGVVGAQVLWRRGDVEHEVVADGFWGASPAYAVAVVRRLGLEAGERARLRLVAVLEPVLATRTVDTSWLRASAQVWRVEDLATGEARELRISDGVLVGGTGLTLTQT